MGVNMKKLIAVGDVFKINSGGTVTVVEIRSYMEVIVKHNDEHQHIATVQAGQLKLGNVKNPFYPAVFGVGYFGCGSYAAKHGSKHSPAYKTWHNMIQRCYSAAYQAKKPTYIGCTVTAEWLNFQSFAEWFYQQSNSDAEGFALDKDLMVMGGKEYSPESCSFVPQEINALLISQERSRGKWPAGVYFDKEKCKFKAQINASKTRISLGYYACPQEAFNAYKVAKESHVKIIASKFEDNLHPVVYSNLMSYSVTP